MCRPLPYKFVDNYKRTCKSCGKIIYYKHRKSYIRAERKNSMCYECTSPGKPLSEKHRKTIGNTLRGKYTGEKASGWKGGINKINNSIRNLSIYSNWRTNIYKRDNYTCQICGKRGEKLNVHHKKFLSFLLKQYDIKTTKDAINKKELWDIKLGITLCEQCHKKLHIKKDINLMIQVVK